MINRKPRRTRKQEQWVDVPLPEGTYADTTRPFSQQDVVNCLKETAEAQGTRSAFKLLGVPGLKPWASIGDGPFRGARNVESKRFVVLGHYLYQMNRDGSDATQLGYVPGNGLVQMSHNQIANGHEVAIATGSAGYIYNTVTGVYGKITDPSFSGGRSVTFIDQMFVWVDAQGRHFQPSNIAAGTEYTALEEQEAEMAPDKIQCAVAAHQKLYVFGKETLQAYTSTGDPEELFSDDKAGIDVGCASPHAVALIDNTLIWVDNKGILRRLNGGIAQRISTHPIEKAWAQCDLSKCFVYTWEDVGHAVVYITFPDGMTWGYDCATQRIHRRQSKGMRRCRLNGLVQWDGTWYGGAFNSGELYELDWDYPLEGCDELVSRVVVPDLHSAGNRFQVDGVRIQFDTGHPTVPCVHVDALDVTTEQDFAILPYFIGQGAPSPALRDSYVTPTIGLSGISTNSLGESNELPLGGDYALTYGPGSVLYAWKMNRATGLYEAYTITDTVTSTVFTMARDGSWFIAKNGSTLYSFKNTGSAFVRTNTVAATYSYTYLLFAPDGSRFAAIDGSHIELLGFNATTGAMTAGINGGQNAERLAWSRDSRYLAVILSNSAPTAGTLWVYDTNNTDSTLTFKDSVSAATGNRSALCWNRDGSKIFYTNSGGGGFGVARFDGTTLTEAADISTAMDYVAALALSPSGRFLIAIPFGSFDSVLYAIGNDGLGSTFTQVGSGTFTADRGGAWTDFYDDWVSS